MNEREAQNQGMYFVGNTADPWDEQKIAKLKELAQQIRKLGFRAVVVKSGVREWGGGDYVLYADKDYNNYRRALEVKKDLLRYEERKEELRKKYEALLQELEDEYARDKALVDDIEKKLGREIRVDESVRTVSTRKILKEYIVDHDESLPEDEDNELFVYQWYWGEPKKDYKWFLDNFSEEERRKAYEYFKKQGMSFHDKFTYFNPVQKPKMPWEESVNKNSKLSLEETTKRS